MPEASRLVLVLGGTRSGKSEVAERLAASAEGPVTYLATGTADGDGMGDRIALHRARRPSTWVTVECGADLARTLTRLPPGAVLVDSLGTWLAAHHDFVADVPALVTALAARTGTTVVVSEEVGLAVHPGTELGRLFVDALGHLNQAVAAIAHDVALVVAGRTMWLPPDEAGPR
ncbi:MAG: adenosylcobinamide kinase/adenosylcobinamide phosphate guanyltransferase [Actinobacteria bacterium]|uniref:Adenosylcobinamide kinase n=1 Tax=freshwater metagenome TaxID=449393 RepID=A0A6J7MFZ7_9ZZZZ|nr:adenosylcobinamide kinase/adenosylcobinamide phosphate guanyltransferase [Actinomycetota bacterium]MSX80634.1 adenosylcobinamide kinase/adenosylcobinamide phosphate guanyltransferase [Actinomycetota bacterium]